jgi:bifunctional ADP-heptose synthase (sugar kinase/adenylyltransferase)
MAMSSFKSLKKEDLYQHLEDISKLKVLVVGETIIDDYQYGYTLGKSGKAPIVAFQEKELESYPGGVLAIYNHLREFVNVDYYTSEKAIIKKRFIQGNQKLFETYSTEDNKMYKEPNYKISDYDIVIVSDFGHGFLDKERRNLLERGAKFLSLNTQINAGNMGLNTINKYKRANYICVSEGELRMATSTQYEDIKEVILHRFNPSNSVGITLGKNGCIIYSNGELIEIPAFINKIVDAVGAGDAFFSLSSLFSYIDAPAVEIGFFGNIAGAIACTYMGNKGHINKKSVHKYIEKLL